MRIGLEIDGVLADIYQAAVNSFGCPDLDSAYSLEEMFVTIPDAVWNDWYTRDTTYLHMPVVRGAANGLDELSESHSVFIITSRPSYAANVTCKWLRDNGFTAKSAIHVSDKSLRVEQMGLDIFIDSIPETINDLSGKTDGYLFSQPFNTHRAVRGKRVADWDDILARLKWLK